MIQCQNNENHEINSIPHQNLENTENVIIHARITKVLKFLKVQRHNHENYENVIIPFQKNKNHKIHRIQLQKSEINGNYIIQ